MIAIVASLVPLAFKEQTDIFVMIDWVTTGIFVVDYILRWWTADHKFGDKSVKSYIKYPFTFMAIVDLIAILPSLGERRPLGYLFTNGGENGRYYDVCRCDL